MIVMLGVFYFIPESPRWLGKQDLHEQQAEVMKKIYKEEYFDEANKILSKEIEQLKEENRMSETEKIKSLCTTYSRCLVIGCGI